MFDLLPTDEQKQALTDYIRFYCNVDDSCLMEDGTIIYPVIVQAIKTINEDANISFETMAKDIGASFGVIIPAVCLERMVTTGYMF